MKALISINRGFQSLFDGKVEPESVEYVEGETRSAVIAEFSSFNQVCSYAYTTQLANSVGILIDRNPDIDALGLPEEIKNLLPQNGTFRITSRIGYEEEIGKLFSGFRVDLKNPDFNIELDEFFKDGKGEFMISLDLSGDLSKRVYKVFNNPLSLKGTTAYGALRLAGYKKGKTLLNPYCNSGTLEIEAALYNNSISPKLYDKKFPFTRLKGYDERIFKEADSKMKSDVLKITAADPLLRNITAAKKNAKIAGVEKYLNFRRIDIDWMDIKHDEKAFDFIMTFIPGSSKHKNPAVLKKEFDQLFYQAEYIIKKDGVLAILCLTKDLLMESASRYFVLGAGKEMYSGTQLMHLLMFRKIARKDALEKKKKLGE